MAVEARSLSAISQLASNPPKDASIKHATEESAISLYIAAIPGKKDLGLTPVKPGPRLRDWDIGSMVYLLRFDDVESYQQRARQWGAFGRVTHQQHTPIAESDEVSRKSLPSTAKIHPALNSGRTSSSDNSFNPDIHVPFELLANADSYEPESLGVLPDRVLNAQGASVAELDLIGASDAPITLIRRGESWSEPEAVARMLDPHSKTPHPSTTTGDLASGRPAFIDILNPAYNTFGQQLKYTEPEGGQCLTRRMYQETGLSRPKLVFLTPYRDFCIFETTKSYMDCYRVTRSKDGLANPVKVLVSRLSFNMQRTAPLRNTRDRSRSLLKESAFNPHSTAAAARSASSDVPVQPSRGKRMLTSLNDTLNPALEKAAESKNLKRITALLPGRRARPTHAIASENALRRGSADLSPTGPSDAEREYEMMQKGFAAMTAGKTSPPPGDGSVNNEVEDDINLPYEEVEEETLGIDSAKLGKLVIHAAGQDFLDLVVAANMVVFTRVYETVRQGEGKK